jgi:ABC-type dipeptide/oligopeptide/nickel transport system permease component
MRALMAGFIVRRIFSLFVVLLFAVTLSFCLLRLAPGSPFNLNERQSTPENIAKAERKHNLDGPLWLRSARCLRASAGCSRGTCTTA